MSERTHTQDGPGLGPRLLVIFVLALLLAAGIHDTHAWPVDWRLYSKIRGPTAGSYYAYRVGADGNEHAIDFDRLPYAYQRTRYILARIERFETEKRESICDAIAHGERGEGRTVERIRLYWERRKVVPVDGERTTPLIERELRYTCARPGPTS